MEKTKLKELNKRTKDLLCAISPDDVITFSADGKIFLGGKLVTDLEKNNLVAEAKFLQDSNIWRVFTGNIRNTTQKVMFESAESYDDIIVGKAMLYNLSILNKIVENLVKIASLAKEKVL